MASIPNIPLQTSETKTVCITPEVRVVPLSEKSRSLKFAK